MNWIKEIKYFYDWLGDHALSHGAQVLWFYLMYRNNACALPTTSGVKGRHPGIYTMIPFVKNLGPVTRENLGGGQALVYDYVGGMHDTAVIKNSQNGKIAANETTALSSF